MSSNLVSLVVAVCSLLCVAAEDPQQHALRVALQRVLDGYPLIQGQALQLGWKSATMEFAIASGTYNQTGPDGRLPRNATSEDTFLFGSGSKSFTAAAVMRLVEKGELSLDDPVSKWVDSVIAKLRATSACPTCANTWGGIFPGTNGSRVTVGELLQMRSGLADYDRPDFDAYILKNRSSDVVSPLDFIDYVAQLPEPFLFEPGTSSSYSSAGYVVAGLVLTGAMHLGSDWATLKTGDLYPPKVQSDLRRAHYFTNEPLGRYLTGPGLAPTGGYPAPGPPTGGTVMFSQNSSVLGYTCSNVVAPALDVATFFWDLLGPEPQIVSESSVKQMLDFKPLGMGWGNTSYLYGIGLMSTGSFKKTGSWVGHGGYVYGFSSIQGVFHGFNASMSVVSNAGNAANDVSCPVLVAAAEVLGLIPKNYNATMCKAKPTASQKSYIGGGDCVFNREGGFSYRNMCSHGTYHQELWIGDACRGPVFESYEWPTDTCLCAGADNMMITCESNVVTYSTWLNPYLTCGGSQGVPQVCGRPPQTRSVVTFLGGSAWATQPVGNPTRGAQVLII